MSTAGSVLARLFGLSIRFTPAAPFLSFDTPPFAAEQDMHRNLAENTDEVQGDHVANHEDHLQLHYRLILKLIRLRKPPLFQSTY